MKTKSYIVLAVLLSAMCTGCKKENLANMVAIPSKSPEESFENKNDTAKTRAEDLAQELKKIKEIEHASVVITGNTAIVGIIIYGEPNDKELIEIKRLAERNVKAFDKDIDHVAVSASAELYERITNLGGGKSKSEEDELHENDDKDVIFRLTPTI